jgi:hypothetical protein
MKALVGGVVVATLLMFIMGWFDHRSATDSRSFSHALVGLLFVIGDALAAQPILPMQAAP